MKLKVALATLALPLLIALSVGTGEAIQLAG